MGANRHYRAMPSPEFRNHEGLRVRDIEMEALQEWRGLRFI
jgi:hypothetical protein